MQRTSKLHAIAGALALTLISVFWISTMIAETLGSPADIARVKTLILYGFALLVPALASTGMSGNRLGSGWRQAPVARKRKRLAFAGANGVFVLIPAAVFLAIRAQSGQIDAVFYAVQTIELVAGALNILLLSLNMRDGLALRRQRR